MDKIDLLQQVYCHTKCAELARFESSSDAMQVVSTIQHLYHHNTHNHQRMANYILQYVTVLLSSDIEHLFYYIDFLLYRQLIYLLYQFVVGYLFQTLNRAFSIDHHQ